MSSDRLDGYPQDAPPIEHRETERGDVSAWPAAPTAVGVRASRALAIAALACGALAVGALAIGRLGIGGLVIGRARIRRLEIDELDVKLLRVNELQIVDGPATSGDNTPRSG